METKNTKIVWIGLTFFLLVGCGLKIPGDWGGLKEEDIKWEELKRIGSCSTPASDGLPESCQDIYVNKFLRDLGSNNFCSEGKLKQEECTTGGALGQCDIKFAPREGSTNLFGVWRGRTRYYPKVRENLDTARSICTHLDGNSDDSYRIRTEWKEPFF